MPLFLFVIASKLNISVCYKSEFWNEKVFFKLMNNNIYGTTVTKKINARLGNNAKKYKTYKNEFMGWRRNKQIVSRTSIL